MRIIILTFLVSFSLQVMGQEKSLSEKIGKATLEQVKSSMGIYEDEELLSFVMTVGKKLEAQMGDKKKYDFKYYLVDTEDPNAFATAGGYVFVTRGLLAIIDTEDELAGVLGHEFSHVLLNHSEKKLARKIVPTLLELPGNIVGALFSETVGALLNAPIELTSNTVGSAFDRGQENQADKAGLALAAKAGFDPEALSSALTKLEFYVTTLSGKKSSFSLFDDHPLTDKRLKNLSEELSVMPDFEGTDESILSDLDGLVVGQNPRNGVVTSDNNFLHPDMNFAMQLPTDWRTKNTPESLTAVDQITRAALVLGFDGKHETPKAAYKDYVKELKGKKGLMLTVDKKKDVNGFEAVELFVESGKDKIVITWIKFGEMEGVLQLMGTANKEAQMDSVLASINSFNTITDSERGQVVTTRLRYEAAPDMTLSEYAVQKNLTDHLVLLEVINSTTKDERVKGEFIKFVEEEPYKP
ncbi:M48 family metalloprotease [Reichenbachiella agariperforans]|uniref:M48 family metalloprotease n=1 Tax=Reichenbachiella agariperforans TaxID=156994 RepID=UPI001C09C2B1|nr:M48 family metalloprotease [Reichenbachiella agariperforans]MBU2914501.1 M48 family metalloprotease [Reichenbachiella agariperforans]